jgi:hypothetical protein
MTAEVGSTPSPPPVTDEPAPPKKEKKKKPRKREKLRRSQIEIGAAILAAVVATYALSLLGIHALQREQTPLPPLDLGQGGGNATVVELRVEELKTVANRLTANVLVYPGIEQYDNRFDVLGNDVAVRLYPTNDLGDLQYPKGRAPAELTTTIEAHGNPRNWPFDTYKTEPIAADAFVGSGDNRKKLPAIVEVTGTWYAAMLFAVVPLRNLLPGAPPPGSWIDQALVQWVLIAMVTAMSLYFFAWVRQGD